MKRRQRRTEALPAQATAARLLPLAAEHHRAGRLAQAQELYRQILAEQPDHADALHLMGVLAHQTGASATAVALITRAIALGNRLPEVHANLGLILQSLGRLDEAAAAFTQVTALCPERAEAHHALGAIRHRQGRFDEAATQYRKALSLKPDLAEAHLAQGLLAKADGRPGDAEASYRTVLGLRPDHPGVLMNLGNALGDQGRHAEALACFQRALAVRPDYAEAYLNLGNALKDLDDPDAALAAYAQALALRPDLAEAWNNRGEVLQVLGALSDAMAAFDQALAIRPDYAEAHYNRADLKCFRADDPDLAALERLGATVDRLPASQALLVHFALGKALEDVGCTDRAFQHILKGNALKRRSLVYDEAGTRALFHRIATVFDADLLASKQGVGEPSSVPIFIVGMPRSGSTLVEQILASHPDVLGAGELGVLGTLSGGPLGAQARPYPEGVRDLDAEALADLGRAYLAQLPPLPAGRSRITDKMPNNLLHIGLIRLILPNAKIIHTVRDPIDTCISCFSKLFEHGQEFSFDLEELGRYYRCTQDLVAHWRRVLPDEAILDVRYEALVDDLEGQTRRMLDYCGLAWDPRCLDFHQTRRNIKTASATQVRQPLFRSSLGRGHRHQSDLAPLLRGLHGSLEST